MSAIEHLLIGYSVDTYFGLVASGALAPDERVELLEGVIVAEPPQEPRHASAITRLYGALWAGLEGRAVVRVQLPFIVGSHSAPEPDIAVVPGAEADYDTRHPTMALLIVEVADSSLPQDRLSKQRLYSAAGCPEYWIVNLRDDCVEVYRTPDAATRRYTERRMAHRGDSLDLVALPGVRICVENIVPARPIA